MSNTFEDSVRSAMNEGEDYTEKVRRACGEIEEKIREIRELKENAKRNVMGGLLLKGARRSEIRGLRGDGEIKKDVMEKKEIVMMPMIYACCIVVVFGVWLYYYMQEIIVSRYSFL